VSKVHNKPIKRSSIGFNKGAKRQPKAPLVWGHRTVRCTTGQCPVLQGKSCLRNSPASGIHFSRSAKIHRSVRCIHGATAISAPTATCDALNARAARAEVRRAHTGAPDSQQYRSGAPPDIQAGPEVRTPTVGIQRHW
jgi:hypothetical protein